MGYGVRIFLSESVNDIAQTNYAAQSAAIDNQAAQIRTQRVQQTANNTSWENKLAQTIYHHQNSWWAKGILGFSDALNSDAGKWLLNSLHSDAAMVENLNPVNAIATAATGFDALTHQSVTTVQAYEDFAASTVGLFSGEVADAALGYAGKMLPSLGRNWAGMFGSRAVLTNPAITANRLIASSERISSDVVNKPFITDDAKAAGWNPPYPNGLSLRKITLSKETVFYRVHVYEQRAFGEFFAQQKEIAPFLHDSEALRIHLGLPKQPMYITEVHVPADTEMYVGRIGSQPNFGLMERSGFQYQLVDRKSLEPSAFNNTRALAEYQHQLRY